MLDSRLHLIYLSAVFLMLGFGMLIGSSLYLPAQIKQQQQTLQSLQSQVDGAVQDGRVAKARLTQLEDGLENLRPHLVRNVLTGHRVDVIQCSDYPQATSSAAGALQDAGAAVPAVIVINDQLIDISPDRAVAVRNNLLATDPTLSASGGEDTLSLIIAAIARALLHGAPQGSPAEATIHDLERENLIMLTGDITQPCSQFVLVGGRNDDGYPDQSTASDTEGLLADQLSVPGNAASSVVGCEPLDAAISSIPEYQKSEIATVDCIDDPVGKVALPFALRGERDDFGLKNTARRVLPASLLGSNGQ